MSQERPTNQSQCDPQQGAVPKQRHGDFLSSPNMLPFDMMSARAFDTSPFSAGMPSFLPPTQNLFAHPLTHYAPQFSGFGYPYLAQFPGPPPSAMASTEVLISDNNKDKSQPKAEFNPSKEYNPQPPRRALWPNYAPGYASQPGPKHSRLPSNDVARKTPRKSTAGSPPQNESLRSSNNTSKPTQRRTARHEYRRRHESPLLLQHKRGAKSGTPRATRLPASDEKSGPLENLTSLKNLTPLKNQVSPLPSFARNRPVILDDEDGGEEDDDDLPLRTLVETRSAGTPLHGPAATAPGTNTRSRCRAVLARSRPQPRYEYLVPDDLKGIQRALGEDSWNNYLILMESKILEEITEIDFIVRSKALFMVFDDKTGKRLQRQIAKTVVLPVIEQHRKHDLER